MNKVFLRFYYIYPVIDYYSSKLPQKTKMLAVRTLVGPRLGVAVQLSRVSGGPVHPARPVGPQTF